MKYKTLGDLVNSQISDIFRHLSVEDINELVMQGSYGEINDFYKFIQEQKSIDLLKLLYPTSLTYLLKIISPKNFEKFLSFINTNNATSLLENVDPDVIYKLYTESSELQKNRLQEILSENQALALTIRLTRDRLKELDVKEQIMLAEEDASLSLDRINKLKAKERVLEQEIHQKEKNHRRKLETLKNEVIDSEQTIQNLHHREAELNGIVEKLRKEHEKYKEIQIKEIVPEYVKNALQLLEAKEKDFTSKASRWNITGSTAIMLAVTSAVLALYFGSLEFKQAAKENIDWFFFSYLILKGLIVVTLFGALATHSFNLGNAYMHEALKRSDRMHAINFGKLYLEIYGKEVSQYDMKDIFENWNLESDSAFTKIKPSNFDPKIIEQFTDVLKAFNEAKKADKDTKSGE